MGEVEHSPHPLERSITGKIYQSQDGSSQIVCRTYAHDLAIGPNNLRDSEGRDRGY